VTIADAIAAIRAAMAAGDAAGACATATAALATPSLVAPERVMLLKLRAYAHETLADVHAAIADLEGVLALEPSDVRATNELGIAQADAGFTEAALATFLRATRLDPQYARGWNNYGNALRGAGRAEAALEAFTHAVRVDPNYALAWANVGAARRETGDDAGAESALQRALALRPGLQPAILTLAGLRRQFGRIDEAAALYAQAAAQDPADANAALLQGATLAERDDLAGARAAFDLALARDPTLLRAALARGLVLPQVPEDAAVAAAARADYARNLATLAAEVPQRARPLSPERAADELRHCNFLLAYQGGDDRALQAQYGALVHAVLAARAPELLVAPPVRKAADGRVRVGFLSAFFRDSTMGRYFERWITDLPRDRFEVTVYHLYPSIDEVGERIRARADTFRHTPRWRPAQLAPRVRADALEVLVYPELGMDATTFGLASLRLAARQCAAWGHPVTSGLPTIDTYLTCAAMEPPDAAAHYTESLHALPGIGTRYALPGEAAAAERAAHGLPADVPLFLCPQSLFKIHPDDDALLARVLAAVPAAHLVLFEGRHPALTAKLAARLAAACRAQGAEAGARVHFVPQRAHADYLALNRCCDAMLDTTHWSGGNTALDALACGLPIVTLPGRFMRARQSAAILRQAGVPELVADDGSGYVRIAASLAADRPQRDALSARLLAGRAAVFDDPAPIAALAAALEGMRSA